MFTYFEFHDSVLAAIRREPDRCVLELRPAYVHQSEGTPGVDEGEGFWQDLDISIDGVGLGAPCLPAPSRISDAHLTVGAIRMSNLAPITLKERAPVRLHMWMMSGTDFTIEGSSIEIRAVGEPEFAESFPGRSA